jgi:hypothetical protein
MHVELRAQAANFLRDAKEPTLECVRTALCATPASMRQDVAGRNRACAPNAKNARTPSTLLIAEALHQELVTMIQVRFRTNTYR